MIKFIIGFVLVVVGASYLGVLNVIIGGCHWAFSSTVSLVSALVGVI
jgi:hypothetical protein